MISECKGSKKLNSERLIERHFKFFEWPRDRVLPVKATPRIGSLKRELESVGCNFVHSRVSCCQICIHISQFSETTALGSIHFLEGGWAGGIPMSMNVKSPSPPFIFLLKNVTLPQEAVKFIVTHPFLLTNWFVAGLCNDPAVLHTDAPVS